MKLRILIVAVACLFSLSAFALPDYPVYTTYYDEEGCEVGYRSLNCAGQWSSSGTTTDNYVVEYGEQCHNEVELITCQDVGLTTIENWPSNFCVTEGFRLWFCSNYPGACF